MFELIFCVWDGCDWYIGVGFKKKKKSIVEYWGRFVSEGRFDILSLNEERNRERYWLILKGW